ncbi:unnamed protein product, partial [Amoebophrya sp. A25]
AGASRGPHTDGVSSRPQPTTTDVLPMRPETSTEGVPDLAPAQVPSEQDVEMSTTSSVVENISSSSETAYPRPYRVVVPDEVNGPIVRILKSAGFPMPQVAVLSWVCIQSGISSITLAALLRKVVGRLTSGAAASNSNSKFTTTTTTGGSSAAAPSSILSKLRGHVRLSPFAFGLILYELW